MNDFLIWILHSTTSGSVVICLLLLFRRLFCRKTPAIWRYAIWLLALICLINPWRPPSPLSIMQAAAPVVERFEAPLHLIVPTEVRSIRSNPISPKREDVNDTPHPQGEQQNGALLLFCVWITGAASTFLYFLLKNIRFSRQLRKCPSDSDVQQACDDLSFSMRIRHRVWCYVTDVVASPCIVSLHLRLCVTPDVAASADDLRFALIHALNHIRQHDAWTAWFRNAVLVLHWFNPLVWLASRVARQDAELSCDALALVSPIGETADWYRHMLPHMLINAKARPRWIKERISMLDASAGSSQGGIVPLGLAALLLAITCLTDSTPPLRSPSLETALVLSTPTSEPPPIPTPAIPPSVSPPPTATPIPDPPPRFGFADLADIATVGLRFPTSWDDPDATRLEDALAMFGEPMERLDWYDESSLSLYGPGKRTVHLQYVGWTLGFDELNDDDYVLVYVGTVSDRIHMASDENLARISYPRGLNREMKHEEALALFWGTRETARDARTGGERGALYALLYREETEDGSVYEGSQVTGNEGYQSDRYWFTHRIPLCDGTLNSMAISIHFGYVHEELYDIAVALDITPVGRKPRENSWWPYY